MQVAHTVHDIRAIVGRPGRPDRQVVLVPTLGALTGAHAELIQWARQSSGLTVVSIFVNPLQFGPDEDFDQYPRTRDADLALCERLGVDAVFLPGSADMYPEPQQIFVEPGAVGERLCGAGRPGHFRGVLTVVAKLLQIVRPDTAVFGQKDYQQTLLIGRMVHDLNMPVTVVMRPTVREADGLAVSSRNRYLADQERPAAAVLYRALSQVRSMYEAGERGVDNLEERLNRVLKTEPQIKIDYAAVVDAFTLEPVKRLDGRAVAAVAVYLGQTRLIDNVLLDDRDIIQTSSGVFTI